MKRVKKKQTIFESIIEFALLLLVVFLIRTFGFGLYQVPTGSMETSMLVGERFFANKFSYLLYEPNRGDVIAFNEPPAFYNYSDNPITNMFQHYVWGPSNWTKRVIGKPEDTVRGAIEDGKPVVYVNDTKLDEPYLNKYPLIRLWRNDPSELREQLEREIKPLIQSGSLADSAVVEKLIEQKLGNQFVCKSYDPNVSFDKQPFYRIRPERVIRDSEGKLELIWPGTPIQPKNGAVDLISRKRNYWDGSDEFYVKLGPDEYWVMGDNRLGSKDSRVFGPIKRKLIHGKIILRIWSIDSDDSWWILDLIKHPIDFWTRVRWSRFFQWIN